MGVEAPTKEVRQRLGSRESLQVDRDGIPGEEITGIKEVELRVHDIFRKQLAGECG